MGWGGGGGVVVVGGGYGISLWQAHQIKHMTFYACDALWADNKGSPLIHHQFSYPASISAVEFVSIMSHGWRPPVALTSYSQTKCLFQSTSEESVNTGQSRCFYEFLSLSSPKPTQQLNTLGNKIPKRKTNINTKRSLLTHCLNTFTCPWNWKSPITDKMPANECFLSLHERFSTGSWIKSCSKGWERLIRQAVQSSSLNKRGDLIQRGNRFLRGRENRNHLIEYFQRFLDGISFLSNQHLT